MSFFWHDGRLSETSVQPFDLTDRGLTLGDGLFDTSLARGGKVFLREAHLKRFFEGANALGIACDEKVVAEALDTLAKAVGDGALRITLTRGGGARGLRLPDNPKPVLFGTAAPDRKDLIFASLSLATTSIRRNETSPSSRIKTLTYLDAILANREVQEKGADEALFLNSKDHVACAATGNLFAIFGDRVVTPKLEDGALAGTTRGFVLAEAARLCDAREESLSLEDWQKADAIFLTNSLRLIAPCDSLDGAEMVSSKHPLIVKLQETLRTAIHAECRSF